MSSARSHYTAVSQELCPHCQAQLGAGRGRCWHCANAAEEAERSRYADFLCGVEFAQDSAPHRLAKHLASNGIFAGLKSQGV